MFHEFALGVLVPSFVAEPNRAGVQIRELDKTTVMRLGMMNRIDNTTNLTTEREVGTRGSIRR